MLRKWGTRLGLAGAMLAGGIIGTSLFVEDQVAKGQGAQFDARSLTAIGQLINETGLATWPQFSADPDTCNAANAGAYYYNTGTDQFRTCNGTSWSDGGGGPAELTDLTDVFISAPSNNQALIYDGAVDNRWENAAQGAAAINDHSDAAITAPSDGDIIQYDGVTDMRWENVAGASPTTLAGLSDVTITTPARLDGFYRGATVWENTSPKARAWMFPINGHEHDATLSDSASSGANAVIQADNGVRVALAHIPQPIEVDRVVWQAGFTQSGTCDGLYGVGLYTLDGNTLLVDAGGQTVAADAIANVDITNVFLNAGDYLLAFTSDSVACTWMTFTAVSDPTGSDYEVFINTGNLVLGNATNPGATNTGNLPATTGTITAITGTAEWQPPLVKFVGVDP